ncbi:MAG: COR domain-containing protein, partial [Pirellula sp.]
MQRLLLQVGAHYFDRIKSNSESKIGFFVSNLACDGNSLPPDQQPRCKDSVKGQWQQIDQWIRNSVIRIKDTQGSSVPAYQELAYQMVVGVQEGSTTYDPPKTSKSVPEFAEDVKQYIHERLNDREEELRSNWNNGEFLTEHRAIRTLRFLTNIGCLYWDPKHTGSKAILDQPWAFEQVYKLLERESDSPIRKALCANNGRFDEPFLKKHFWDASGIHDPEDQQLILSFMVSIGVCLPLKKRWQYTIGEGQEYLSPEHLPRDDSQVSSLVNENFDAMNVSPTSIVDQESLHDGHWNAIMRAVAEAYGTDAQFYRNAIFIEGVYRKDRHAGESKQTKANQDDIPWKILMTYTPVEYSHIESPQVKDEIKAGRIDEMHSASMTEEHLGEFYNLVKSLCPGGSGNEKEAREKLEREYGSLGPEPTVFLSYG